MLTRAQQVNFCKQCTKRQFDLDQGLICGLTGQVADFDKHCPDYEQDRTVKPKKKSPIYYSINELKDYLQPEERKKLMSQQRFPLALLAGLVVVGLVTFTVAEILASSPLIFPTTSRGEGAPSVDQLLRTILFPLFIAPLLIIIAGVKGLLIGYFMRLAGRGITNKFIVLTTLVIILGCAFGNIWGITMHETKQHFWEVIPGCNFLDILEKNFTAQLVFFNIIYCWVASFMAARNTLRKIKRQQLN